VRSRAAFDGWPAADGSMRGVVSVSGIAASESLNVELTFQAL
jgi:hypothetical protein